MERNGSAVRTSISSTSRPQPFLRWAGGKRKLADLLIDSIPNDFDPEVNRYFEPFIGGGAVLFTLGDPNKNLYIPGKNVFLNDSNPDLVITYKIVKNEIDALTKKLSTLAKDTGKEAYDRIRNYSPKGDVSRAARFIYLNKTCFNGLWRVNSKGIFNVPFGKLKNPKIFDKENLQACSKRLQGAHITGLDFSKAVMKATRGDLVYFDPPYLPLSSSANFSKYAKDDFSKNDHVRLAETIKVLIDKGVHVILSNSDTDQSREIFGPILNLRQIPMNRSISASGTSRKPVMEILGVSFPIKKGRQLSTFTQISKAKV